MKLWVGVTDKDWYEYLLSRAPDEVNFWQPSGSRNFRVLQPGEPFLFKLHSPDNFIVGGGHFVRYSALPASLAWEAFGEKNGVVSHEELLERIRRYREHDLVDPVIGCNILAEPFFFAREDWIRVPRTWAANIVQGKTYGPHLVSNGILFRSDIHKLFDLGYVTVTPELRLEVSSRLREEWENGREYYAHHGKELGFRPTEAANLPSREFLVWHNENRFKS